MPARNITLTLTRRPDGHFVKKVRGRIRFFGNDSEEQARQRLLEFLRLDGKGRDPTPATGQPAKRVAATVECVADWFLDDLRGRVKGSTYRSYENALDDFGATVAPDTFVDDLTPQAFAQVRAPWAVRFGPWALDRHVQAVRTMFNFALDLRLIDRAPFYGHSFSKTTEGDKQRASREKARENGERAFGQEELTKIFAAVGGPLRAMTLLALNGGCTLRTSPPCAAPTCGWRAPSGSSTS